MALTKDFRLTYGISILFINSATIHFINSSSLEPCRMRQQTFSDEAFGKYREHFLAELSEVVIKPNRHIETW